MGATTVLYIISDLHLGGEPGFQMCPPEARRRLARFFHKLARTASTEPEDRRTELVINGDLVDFLAERDFRAFTHRSGAAVDKLRAIITHSDDAKDPEERPFAALGEFVRQGHPLTILLGNHDVELCLPRVRQALLDELTDGKPARVEFLFDGEALARGDLLVEHGNRYDGWNAVAWGQLRAYRSLVSRGEPAWPFAPPPGSRLVTEVMNPLKTRYHFIDLLKPENEALVPILCALEPEVVKPLQGIVPLLGQRLAVPVKGGRVPEAEAYISQAPAGGRGTPSHPADDGPDVSEGSPDRTERDDTPFAAAPYPEGLSGKYMDERTRKLTEAELERGEALLRQLTAQPPSARVPEAEAHIGDNPLAWLRSTFSLWQMRQGGKDRYQHLRDALAAHREAIGATFELGSKDPVYYEAAKRLAAGKRRVVVFGHTHLPRFVSLPGEGAYINTGTWCPTIRLDEALYKPGVNDDKAEQALRQFVEDLAANRQEKWAQLKTLCARVTLAPEKCDAELCEVLEDGTVRALEVGA